MMLASTSRKEVGLIKGQQPDSIWEWWVAVGLAYLGWDFDYQVWLFGGRTLKGGQVIDFLVHTVPLYTPLYVYGDYWHGGPKKDRDALARAFLFATTFGSLRKPEVLDGSKLLDQETTIDALYQLFGRGPRPSIPLSEAPYLVSYYSSIRR